MMMPKKTALRIAKKIAEKKATVGVVGLGYVGLPLAMLCAQKGFRVMGIDSDLAKVIRLQHGRTSMSGVSEETLQVLLTGRKLAVLGNYAILSRCDVIVICVATPLTDGGEPDYTQLFLALEGVASRLRPEQLLIVESTIIPGATLEVILPRLAAGGMKVGQDFYLVFSPERIDPGNKQYRLENTPKLVAGVTADCLQLGQDFYRSLAIEVIPVSTPTVAEMAKLLENTYRDVNIAFINEMAEVCRDLEIDIWEVIAAAATKPFGFQPFYPGIGVGGHCIPKDSAYYLFWARQKGRPAHLVELARKINAERPMAVAAQLKELVAVKQRGLAGSRLLFLGATYKKDVDDIRESPAVKIMERCAAEGAEIAFHDPYIEKLRLGEQILSRISLDEETLAQYQWTILTVPHSSYDYPWLQTVCAHFVDVSHTLGTRDK